jgi:hypothetical protein
MQHTSIDVCPYAFFPVKMLAQRAQKREDSSLATALASLLHHFAAHIAGILGNIAGRLERNALVRRCGPGDVVRTRKNRER